jgi:A/G-specific adenine glycosylase
LATDTLLTTLDGDAQRCTGAAALMELGAVVCTATKPACDRCPVAAACAWKNAGYPSYQGPLPSKQGTYQGSDRQVRGIILRELRTSDIPVPRDFLASLWSDSRQFERALSSLVEDALVVLDESGARLSE